MSFAPVKSDPWKKKPSRRRLRFQLWPDEFWRRLVGTCFAEFESPEITDEQLDMIRKINKRLYGTEAT